MFFCFKEDGSYSPGKNWCFFANTGRVRTDSNREESHTSLGIPKESLGIPKKSLGIPKKFLGISTIFLEIPMNFYDFHRNS